MLRRFGEEVRRHRLIQPGQVVVVAVSGGADSVALLHLFDELRKAPEWPLRLVVAHLNHGLRGVESDADAQFVSQIAHKLGVDCVVACRDVAAIASANGLGIEEASRNERYAFFERVCLQHKATVVAVAHHADDQAETVLHRVLRGTGLRGLAGMAICRPLSRQSTIKLIRPLLHVTRSALLDYLASRDIPFREDQSNADYELMRNRIRHVVLPLLEQQVNPQARRALLQLAEQARWFEHSFHKTVLRTFDSVLIFRTDNSVVFNAISLARKSRLLQTGVVREAYARLGAGEAELGFNHLVAVATLLDDPASGKAIQLPCDVVAEKRYEHLILARVAPATISSEIEQTLLRVPGRTVVPSRSIEIWSERSSIRESAQPILRDSGRWADEYLNWDAIRPPLMVRARRPGDRFFPLGSPGSKKVSDYLTDAKIPPAERQDVVLVSDQLGIIWVVGQRIDDRVKLTGETQHVLHLAARDIH